MQLAQSHCRADRHSTIKRNGTILLAYSGSLSSRCAKKWKQEARENGQKSTG